MEGLYALTKTVVNLNKQYPEFRVVGRKENESDLMNLSDYFTDIEIKEMENTLKLLKNSPEDEEEIKQRLLFFDNVLKVNHDQFVCVVPVQRFIKMYDYNLIKYNTSTQRDTKKSLYRNTIIESININFSQVSEITDLILEGKFIANTITLNVLNEDDRETIFFDEKGNLKIKGEINILDGFHRSLGYQNALTKSKDIDMNIELRITNFDLQKARRFIVQEDKQRKMDISHIQRLEHNYINKLMEILNEKSDFGKLITKGMVANKNELYIPDSAVRKVLTELFDKDLNSMLEVNMIADEMINFLNALYYKLKVEDKRSSRLYEYEFFLYMILFEGLYIHDADMNYKSLVKLLNRFSENEMLKIEERIKSTGSTNLRVNSNTKKVAEKIISDLLLTFLNEGSDE